MNKQATKMPCVTVAKQLSCKQRMAAATTATKGTVPAVVATTFAYNAKRVQGTWALSP